MAIKAAVKAMLVNRIADVFFMLAIFYLFIIFKTLNFNLVFDLIKFIIGDKFFFFSFFISKLDFICLLLFIGSIGKSAQVGLHT